MSSDCGGGVQCDLPVVCVDGVSDSAVPDDSDTSGRVIVGVFSTIHRGVYVERVYPSADLSSLEIGTGAT